MKFQRTVLSISMSAAMATLAGCGGGGGGGGGTSATLNPYLRTEVPFHTPVKVAQVDPLVGNSGTYAVVDIFTADITGTGTSSDVIIAGRSTDSQDLVNHENSKIHMMSWENNTLVDRTNQWFPGGINEVLGTEPSVKFADFFKSGRTDMFVAPSTDKTLYGPAYVFTNQGNHFTRQSLAVNNIWSHDSAIADVNGDTYKDIVMTDYGPGTTLAINDRVSGFRLYQDHRGTAGDLRWGGSSVAVADFLQNGSTQLIVTDTGCVVVGCGTAATKMFSWNIDGSDRLTFDYHSTLPTPRFELPKYAGMTLGGSHAVRVVAYDFNDDLVPDAIVFSRPGNVGIKMSEIQFLKNNGSGAFTDVTDTTLVGYDTNTHATYNPKFMDLNGDGREDILVSAKDFSGTNNSTQFLLKSSDGKYVAAHQNVISDFSKQMHQLAGSENSGNTVNVFRAPNGKLYLVSTATTTAANNDHQLGVYLSEVGTQATMTAKTAVELIQQRWPYMSAIQANDLLARTSATYFGGKVLDWDTLMSPVGTLSLPSINGMMQIRGHIAGVNLVNSQAVVLDEYRRSFTMNLQGMNVDALNMFTRNMEHNDQHGLTSHAEYLVNGPKFTHDNIRIGSEHQNHLNNNGGMNLTPNRQFTNYTVGIPNVYKKGNWSYGAQFTALNQNPWFSMSGAWGEVRGSNIFDNVVSYRQGGFVAQGSLMHVSTSITPGLVTKVSDIIGGWAETGYRYNDYKKLGDMGIYTGVKPTVFSGNIEARMPTSVDMSGNVVYTKHSMSIQNQPITYLRAMYRKPLSKSTQFGVNGMILSNGQYRIMNEFRWNLN
jgi:hypothetical protein